MSRISNYSNLHEGYLDNTGYQLKENYAFYKPSSYFYPFLSKCPTGKKCFPAYAGMNAICPGDTTSFNNNLTIPVKPDYLQCKRDTCVYGDSKFNSGETCNNCTFTKENIINSAH